MNNILNKNILLKSVFFGFLVFVIANLLGWIFNYEFDLLASVFGAFLATLVYFSFEWMERKEK